MYKQQWKRLVDNVGVEGDFLDFENFKVWYEQNKQRDMILSRKDITKPHSIENSIFETRSEAKSKLPKKIKHNGISHHPFYKTWNSIKGRKQQFCKEWEENPKLFMDWAKDNCPEGMMITRKDNTLPYSPENCTFGNKRDIALTAERSHGLSYNILYEDWKQMTQRGSRCEEWKDFEVFKTWADSKYEEGLRITCIDGYFSPETTFYLTQKEILKLHNTQEKIQKTCQEKYGTKFVLTLPEVKEKSVLSRSQYKRKFGKSSAELHKESGSKKCETTFTLHLKNFGLDHALKDNCRIQSLLPNSICEYLTSSNIDYVKEKYIDGKYVDILVEGLKLAIECDGLYWHSDKNQKQNNYHIKKREHYIANGYFPLFFREDEIRDKFAIVKGIIGSKLNLNTRLGARKCILKEIEASVANKFFEDNHLMGKGSGKTVGLIYNEEIVAAIRIIKKKTHVEISRFCSKAGYTITGGLSRLLANVNSDIVSFVDLRYGDGHSLAKLGFKLETCYPSFKWTDTYNTFHRMSFKGNSGYENGMYKIWDCGQAKFVKRRTTT